MKTPFRIFIIASFLILSGATVFAAGKPAGHPARATSSISGKVFDFRTGETLAGVTVLVEGTETKVYTDLDGNFTINSLEPGKYNLIVSYISYKASLIENIDLTPTETEEVLVKLDTVK